MSGSARTDIVRAIYRAIDTGDIEAGIALLDPAIEWIVPAETSPDPEVFCGHDGVRRDAKRWRDAWAGEVKVEVDELIEVGDDVVAVVTWSGRGAASGVTTRMELAAVWTFRESVVVRHRHHSSRAGALRAVGVADRG